MKDVKFTRGAVVNLASVSSSAVRVNLDGCLSTDSAVNCRGNDSILVYRGKERSVYESGLQPFTGTTTAPSVNSCISSPCDHVFLHLDFLSLLSLRISVPSNCF